MTSLYFSHRSKGFTGWTNMRMVTNNDCNCFGIKEIDSSYPTPHHFQVDHMLSLFP